MRRWLALALITFSSCDLYSQHYQLTASGSKILDSVYNSYIFNHQVPGLAVGILVRDSVVYAKGFGVKNVKTKEQVTHESLFHVASLSKPFVATGVMQLLARHKIALDSPLIKYLPYFKMGTEKYRAITIRQMLSHTSGLPDVHDYAWDKPQYDIHAGERYVRSLKNEQLAFDPGDDFAYSNLAYDILGEVIANVSGVTFEEYMSNNVLLPAGMHNSTFLRMSVKDHLATSPHVRGRKGVEVSSVYPYNRCHAPSSTLHSSVSDMLKWAVVLNNSLKENHTILAPGSLQQMATSHFEINPFTAAGLGWFIHQDDEIEYIFHTGSDVGFSSMFAFFPEQQVSIVVLSNCDFINVLHATSTAFRVLQQRRPLASFDNLLFVR
jgi:CubicO group peptidase (beta-lactamase class C family)